MKIINIISLSSILALMPLTAAIADTSLYAQIESKFRTAGLWRPQNIASKKGTIISGRCVEASLPNTTHPGYFVVYAADNDPFISFFGMSKYTDQKQYPADFFDKNQNIGNGYISADRIALSLVDDTTFALDYYGGDRMFLRFSENTLITQIISQDEKIIAYCYFHKTYKETP